MRKQKITPSPAKQSDKLPANVWKFYVYKGLWGLGTGLVIPTLVLYYLGRGISLTEFMLLMTVLNFSAFVFEVPTGVIADKFSRKWSICLGTALMTGGVVIMLVTVNFALLALGFLCWGLGSSLVSGADSALLYDSLEAENEAEHFQAIIGNAISLGLATTVLGTLAGGLIVKVLGLSGPMWVWLGLLLGVIIITATFKEPPMLKTIRGKNEAATLGGQIREYVKHLQSSFQLVSRNRELLVLIFIGLVLGRLWATTERPLSQPHLTSFGYSPEMISYFHTIFYLIAAVLAKNSHRISTWLGGNEVGAMLLIGLVGSGAIFMVVNASGGLGVVLGLSSIYVVRGLSQPLIENGLNKRVTSEKRASCLSIANMGNSLAGVLLGPLFGYLADAWSLQTSLYVYQWTFLSLLLLGVFLCWKVLGQGVGVKLAAESN